MAKTLNGLARLFRVVPYVGRYTRYVLYIFVVYLSLLTIYTSTEKRYKQKFFVCVTTYVFKFVGLSPVNILDSFDQWTSELSL